MNTKTNAPATSATPKIPNGIVWLAPRSKRCTPNADKAAAKAKADNSK